MKNYFCIVKQRYSYCTHKKSIHAFTACHVIIPKDQKSHFCNELNNFHKYIQWHIFGCDKLRALGEQTIDNALQTALGGSVAFTFDSNHVHPEMKNISRVDCENIFNSCDDTSLI